MQKIALPQKISYTKSFEPNQGQISIEPCCPGYGITIGNAIRRVLLSSLLGAAPIGVKIEGVDHEFMTLPYLKEDMLEFILNLKQLRLKMHTDEIVKLELKPHGEKTIKAGDIEKNPEVEIINKDLVLGTLTDMAGSLKAEIYVSRGMGYETIEAREEKNNEIGYIEMDSIFSPVLAVGINIENVRVGKMTNWEKLILNITTDGTIEPQEAFNDAVKILIEQFSSLIPEEKSKEKKAGKGQKEDQEKSPLEESAKPAAAPKDEEGLTELKISEAISEEPKKKRGRPKKEE